MINDNDDSLIELRIYPKEKKPYRNHRWISLAESFDNFFDRWKMGRFGPRLAPKWLYLGVKSRSQGCRVTLTAGATPVEGRRGFRWRVETALAPATFSCSRVREERGDGVKHSTTPDGQGVTTRSPDLKTIPFTHERVPADSRSRFLVDRHGSRVSRRVTRHRRVSVDIESIPFLRASNTRLLPPGNLWPVSPLVPVRYA